MRPSGRRRGAAGGRSSPWLSVRRARSPGRRSVRPRRPPCRGEGRSRPRPGRPDRHAGALRGSRLRTLLDWPGAGALDYETPGAPADGDSAADLAREHGAGRHLQHAVDGGGGGRVGGWGCVSQPLADRAPCKGKRRCGELPRHRRVDHDREARREAPRRRRAARPGGRGWGRGPAPTARSARERAGDGSCCEAGRSRRCSGPRTSPARPPGRRLVSLTCAGRGSGDEPRTTCRRGRPRSSPGGG